MAEFAYTPVTSGVQVSQVQGTTKSKAQGNINALMSLASTGLAVAGDIKKADDKTSFNESKNKYLERKKQYTEGLNGVIGNPQAYDAYNKQFQADIATYSEGLTEDYQTMYNSATEGFVNTQSIYVSQAQAKENKANHQQEMTTDVDIIHTLPAGSERQGHLKTLANKNKSKQTMTDKEIEETMYGSHINYALTTMRSEDANYATLASVESEMNDYLQAFPNLKNSKVDTAFKNQLKVLKNTLDAVQKTEIEGYLSVKDFPNFETSLDISLEVGAINDIQYDIYMKKFANKVVNKKQIQLEKADEYFGVANGHVDIAQLKLNPNIDSSTITRLENLTKQKIQTNLSGQIQYSELKKHNNDNPKIFRQVVSDKYEKTVNTFIAGTMDGTLTPEASEGLMSEIRNLDNTVGTFQGSLSSDVKRNSDKFLTIFSSPHIKNKALAFEKISQLGKDYKPVHSNDTNVKAITKDMGIIDALDARHHYSALRYAGVPEADAKEATIKTFSNRELEGVNGNITGTASDMLNISNESEQYTFDALQATYKDQEKVLKSIKEMLGKEGSPTLGYDNGFLTITAEDGSYYRLPNSVKGIEDTLNTFRGEVDKFNIEDKPSFVSNVFSEGMDGLAQGVQSSWDTYDSSFVATTGKAIVDDVTSATKGVSKELKRMYKGTIKNYQKWSDDMNKRYFSK